MKHTPNTLKKLETLYAELGFQVRYGQGNFNSGACILKDSNIVVINKLFNIESRINALVDLVAQIQDKPVVLTSASAKLLKSILNPALEIIEDTEETFAEVSEAENK